jgi:hypothetical protein
MAVNRSTLISAAAAHGITPRVISSWLPSLLRWPRVLVPIEVDALVLRPGSSETWADCRMQEPPVAVDGAAPTDSRSLLPAPFLPLDPQLRTPGVYLHWALPDAITAGTQTYDPDQPNATRNTQFPAIPDRWLVIRIGPDATGGRRSVTGWVLQAESNPPNVIPLDQYTGVATDTSNHGRLTALGHGDPAWAAYFDNVENRLAFHDPLSTDTPAGALAYLVCGWYSDPSDDPLAASETPTLASFEARVKALNWQLDTSALDAAAQASHDHMSAAGVYGLSTPLLGTVLDAARPRVLLDRQVLATNAATSLAGVAEYSSVDAWWPQQILCHGAAVGLGWPTDNWSGNTGDSLSTSAGGPPDASAINVALAATSGEALGTMVANSSGRTDDIRLVEAFSTHVIAEIDQPDGRAKLDAALQTAGFGTVPDPNGDTTEVIRQPPEPPVPPLPSTPSTPGAGIFADRQTQQFPGPNLGFITGKEAQLAASPVGTLRYASPLFSREIGVLQGGLPTVIGALTGGGPSPGPTPHPARDITVQRSLPRYWHQTDPVLLLQSARRSFKHGADGRMNTAGELVCRLTGDTVTSLSLNVPQQPDESASITGADLLTRGVENGAVPPECDSLLNEAVLLDPGSSLAAALAAATGESGVPVDTRRDHVLVEQTVWWALRDPAVQPAPIISRSGYAGHLPSPIAITPPQRPWVPLHLDWEVSVDLDGLSDWTLDELDFVPAAQTGDQTPAASEASPLALQGRSLLTAGIAQAAADAARQALDDATKSAGSGTIPAGMRERYGSEVHRLVIESVTNATSGISVVSGAAAASSGGSGPLTAADRARLGSIAAMLDDIDVLATSLDGLNDQLRKRAPLIAGPPVNPPLPTAPPDGMLAFRSGRVRITRLRLVDCFGQALDLAGSSAQTSADPAKILVGDVMADPANQGTGLLPPRFTAPARLWFRWTDAASGSSDGPINPVCGFIVPNHLDGDIEIFDPAGAGLGTVRPDDTSGIAFEDAPGRPPTVGQSLVDALPDPGVRGLVQGLVDWGRADQSEDREGALSALMRTIDSTRWSVDPFGQSGEEHLAMLIGHPVAVMRATLRLDVIDPVAPPENAWTAVPVRLGALTHWQDGLFGYFVDDDYGTFHVAAEAALMARDIGPGRGLLGPIAQVPAAAGALSSGLSDPYQNPANHPYLDSGLYVWVRPGQVVTLTLLVEPHTTVHATSGLVPRKEIGVRREWVAPGLGAIAPTFRFGPVLVDPKQVALPLAKDLAGTWTWDHRTDVVQWADDSIVDAGKASGLSATPAVANEGWLKLTPPAPSSGSGS